MTRLRLPRALIVAASALAVLGALLVLLVLPVHVTRDTPVGAVSVSCGTAFSAAAVTDCPGAQSTRQAWGFPLLALGVAGVVGGLVVRRAGQRQ